MENNNTPAVQNTAKPTAKSFIAALNAKRKKLMLSLSTMVAMSMVTAISAFADGGGAGGSGAGGNNAGEEQFNTVIQFFATWIGRIGLVVGFIGAVMFGLAIKNDDADAKTRGLMTMASGFVVYAVTFALDMFGITS